MAADRSSVGPSPMASAPQPRAGAVGRLRARLRGLPWLAHAYDRLQWSRREVRDRIDMLVQRLPGPLGRRRRRHPFGFWLYGARSSQHHRAMQRGEFESDELELFRWSLHHAEAVVDVGSNIGFYSLVASQAGRPVVAVEPLERNLALLRRNVVANRGAGRGPVEVLPVGLDEQPGTVTLYAQSGTGASMVPGWAHQRQGYVQQMRTERLDDVVASRFPSGRVLIKVDVEGAEDRVMAGARATLARTPRPIWLMEICLHEHHPAGANPNFAAVFRLFLDQGYHVVSCTPGWPRVGWDDIASWTEGRAKPPGINFLFVPPDMDGPATPAEGVPVLA